MNWAALGQMFGGQGGQGAGLLGQMFGGQGGQGAGLLGQMFGGQGGQGAGFLGQELAAQPAGMQGFMAQADLQPQIGAQQTQGGFQGLSPEEIQGVLGMSAQLAQGPGQGQAPVTPMPALPQGGGGASMPQIDPNAAYQQWMQSRNLPSMGVLGGTANGLR